MTQEQIESLKEHFFEWSGGFEPESAFEITVYVDYACDARLDPAETRRVLLGWMSGKPEGEEESGESFSL